MKVGFFGPESKSLAVLTPFFSAKDVEVQWILRESPRPIRRSSLVVGLNDWNGGQFLDERPVDAVVDFSSEEGMERYRPLADRGILIVSTLGKWGPSGTMVLAYCAPRTAIITGAGETPGRSLATLFLDLAQYLVESPVYCVSDIQVNLRPKLSASLESFLARVVGKMRGRNPIHTREFLPFRQSHTLWSPWQRLRIEYQISHSEGCGDGALSALRWLSQQNPGLYALKDLVHETVQSFIARGNPRPFRWRSP